MYKAVVIEDIQIHIRDQLHDVRMSSDKRIILYILGGTHARDGGIQQQDIAKATSTLEKTIRVRNLQGMMQGALDKRIRRPVNNVKQILALNPRKAQYKSPGGCDHEILRLELAKSFNPNRKEIIVPEYR